MVRNFTHQKRLFLLNKLDEIIKFWATGSGHGSFNFTVKDGIPSLQCDIKLAMEDIGEGTDPVHHNQHKHAHVCRPRQCGPARQAKDRLRAAKHQAALAAATVSVVKLSDNDATAITAPVPAVSTSTLSSVSSVPNPASTSSVASSQMTTTTTSYSLSMPLASTRQLPSALCDVTDMFCPDSQHLANNIPQLDGSMPSNLRDQWSCKCCRYETFFSTEDQLNWHHETHMVGYEDCNICFTGHVWT